MRRARRARTPDPIDTEGRFLIRNPGDPTRVVRCGAVRAGDATRRDANEGARGTRRARDVDAASR